MIGAKDNVNPIRFSERSLKISGVYDEKPKTRGRRFFLRALEFLRMPIVTFSTRLAYPALPLQRFSRAPAPSIPGDALIAAPRRQTGGLYRSDRGGGRRPRRIPCR